MKPKFKKGDLVQCRSKTRGLLSGEVVRVVQSNGHARVVVQHAAGTSLLLGPEKDQLYWPVYEVELAVGDPGDLEP